MTDSKHPPSVLMFLSSHCTHCPAVLQQLGELLKAGSIAELRAINIDLHADLAASYKVRSVPWLQIGDIELTGSQTRAELLTAIEQSQSTDGLPAYYQDLLNNGQLQEAIDHLQKHPDNLLVLVDMLKADDIMISVQMGIGAVMEEFTGSQALINCHDALTTLTQHPSARVRNDACFYLSLTQQKSVIKIIRPLLKDSDADVRETAEDCIEELEQLDD